MPAPVITTTDPTNNVSAEVDARLTALLHRLVARRGIHHAIVALMSGDGGRRWSAAAGPAEPGEAPLCPAIPFFVASITKRFIITLVLQAHERHELDLDASICTYLPAEVTAGLHVYRGHDHTSAITVRHLASHTSGLSDFFEKARNGPSLYEHLASGHDIGWTFDDVLRIARQQRPHFEPQDLTAARQKARYSDTGFQLLIRILEIVADQPFADLLTERIIGPLGLAHTWLPGRSTPAAATEASPSPLYARDRRVELPRMIESANDLISTTGDLLDFQRALLAGTLFGHPHTVGLLTERRNRLRNILSIRYGLGTMIASVPRFVAPGRRPATLVGHSGASGTWLFHCPEVDLHLAGTVDQTRGQATPFRVMMRLLRAW